MNPLIVNHMFLCHLAGHSLQTTKLIIVFLQMVRRQDQ